MCCPLSHLYIHTLQCLPQKYHKPSPTLLRVLGVLSLLKMSFNFQLPSHRPWVAAPQNLQLSPARPTSINSSRCWPARWGIQMLLVGAQLTTSRLYWVHLYCWSEAQGHPNLSFSSSAFPVPLYPHHLQSYLQKIETAKYFSGVCSLLHSGVSLVNYFCQCQIDLN